jgi:hypothetical protein
MPYSPPLPFEVDYISRMSEDELYALARELETERFWDREKQVRVLIDECVQRHLSQPGPGFDHLHVPAPESATYSATGYGLTRTYQSIQVRLPAWMSETQARFFVEAQVREQLDPAFDPTDE